MSSTCRNKNIHKFESGTYINCFCILSDIEIIVKNNKMITSNYFCCKKKINLHLAMILKYFTFTIFYLFYISHSKNVLHTKYVILASSHKMVSQNFLRLFPYMKYFLTTKEVMTNF